MIPARRASAGASVDYSGPKVGQNGLVFNPASERQQGHVEGAALPWRQTCRRRAVTCCRLGPEHIGMQMMNPHTDTSLRLRQGSLVLPISQGPVVAKAAVRAATPRIAGFPQVFSTSRRRPVNNHARGAGFVKQDAVWVPEPVQNRQPARAGSVV